MSQFLGVVLAWLAFFRQNPTAAVKLWQAAVTAYETSQAFVNLANDTFGQIMAREVAVVLTPDEEEAERQFNEAFSVARGPFGNGKVLRWLLTTPEGNAFLAVLKTKIPGMGS